MTVDLNDLFVGDLVHLVRTENGKRWHGGPRLVRVEQIRATPLADGAQVMVEYRQGWLRWVRPDQIEPAKPSTIERALFNRDPYDDEYEAEQQGRIDTFQWKYGMKVGKLGPSDGGFWR